MAQEDEESAGHGSEGPGPWLEALEGGVTTGLTVQGGQLTDVVDGASELFMEFRPPPRPWLVA